VLAFTDQHTDVTGDFTATGTALSASASYDPLGNVTATTGAPAGKLGYQSGWTDPATGQVNMTARWYNPAAGQFTSRDTTTVSPVPDPVAANPFAYADDNPLTGTDPTGHSLWGAITSGWHAVTSTVSRGWHAATSWAARGWDATTSWISSTYDRAIARLDAEARALDRAWNQKIKDAASELRRVTARAVHTAARTVTHVAHAATHYVATAYHEVKRVSLATATFVKHHQAAIVSFAAGAAVFAGCEGLSLGIATIGCAAAAGAAGGLVSYGMSCGSAAGGCSVEGAVISAGVGALGGAAGGAIAGPLGGKLASSVLGDILPDLAVQGLTGATAGAAAGATAGAASYGLNCQSTSQGCTWGGLATTTAETAAGGAITGGVASTVLGALTPTPSPDNAAGDTGPPAQLKAGQKFEQQQLAALGVAKNTTIWRPTSEQMNSAAFQIIVGEPKFSPSGAPVGVITDSAGLEIKGGTSPLVSSYQLRLMTYQALVSDQPLTIRTTRPVVPVFRDWLTRWGVSVEAP